MEPPNAWDYHGNLRQWFILLGTKFYVAEPDIPEWESVLCISRDEPFSAKTDYSEYKDKIIFFNGNGTFKVHPADTFPIAYRVNTPPPNIRILTIPDFTGAQCRYRYLYSAARLQRDGGIVDRQTPSVIDQETGTNIADENTIDYGEIYKKNAITPASPQLVQELWVPVVPNTDPQEYQWHLSNFPIYRTFDLEAKDVSDVTKDKYNDPNRFIWTKDLRICAAFYGWIFDNLFVAIRGEFEIADTHSILELDNGERYEILEWINEYTVRIASEYYDYGTRGPYAAAIGNGRVIRATVTGNVVTRTNGSTFTAADVRRTIWNSGGYRMYITEYIDEDRVRVHIEGDLPVQGFTMDPIRRKYFDVITDEILRARMDFYSCAGRYRVALPSCNLGKIIPGFVICAYRGQKEIYYSHIPNNLDYFIGQHVATQISDEVQDAITILLVFQEVFSIICATTTWGGQIGLSEFMTLPNSNESIALLPGIKLIDKHTGCLDPGSAKEVENGVVELMTNEPGGEALRQFNGMNYSAENFLVDTSLGGRVERLVNKTKRLSTAIYDGFMGYILWRKGK
jgi:hypothetical protein